MLNKDFGFRYLATRHLNQDPLEIFFGSIRSQCEENRHPTVPRIFYFSSFKSVLINNIVSLSDYSNCEADNSNFLLPLEVLLSRNIEAEPRPEPVRPIPQVVCELSQAAYRD